MRAPQKPGRFPRALGGVFLLLSCTHASTPPSTVGEVEVRMDFQRGSGFYAAPFPNDSLAAPDGRIDLSRFPNPYNIDLLAQALTLLARDARGFAMTGGVFFSLTGALDGSRLPDVLGTTQPGSGVFLVAVDVSSSDFMKYHPLEVTFSDNGGPMGARNLLALLPFQGVPLRAATTYAAVVRSTVVDGTGKTLKPSAVVAQLAAGQTPPGMTQTARATHARALTALAAAGIPAEQVAGLTVFTTGDPPARLREAVDQARDAALAVTGEAFHQTDTLDDYCVYQSTVSMPDYQQGTPPFSATGGDWAVNAAGRLVLQRMEVATLVVTIPRQVMPAGGYPAAVFIRTGGGGDRPLVDRGPQAVAHGPSIAPGEGPARQFARAGFAGISVDGPLGGLRNTTHADEQFLVFNVFNPPALRDNLRQSALELALLAHLVHTWTVDTSSCPGAVTAAGGRTVHLDDAMLALMGHSMGASIAPLVLAAEPMYRAMALSGAGASWIENVLYKIEPATVKPALEALFGYSELGISLTATDPTTTLVQWAAEDADAQVYARTLVQAPLDGEGARHVLMMQGLVDHYILPNIANALTLSLGLDLGGTPLDVLHPELAGQIPVERVLPLVGRQRISLPAQGNQASGVTAVVVQHAGDAIEDGHEAFFQTPAPRHQLECFLATLARGTPVVVPTNVPNAPCP